jgi:hypothetical protein
MKDVIQRLNAVEQGDPHAASWLLPATWETVSFRREQKGTHWAGIETTGSSVPSPALH